MAVVFCRRASKQLLLLTVIGAFAAGCSVDLGNVFTETTGGQTTEGGSAGSVSGGAGQGGTGSGATTQTSSSTSSTTTTTTTTTTTSTGTMTTPMCGNGQCDPGENAGNCFVDCGGVACAHGVCQWSDTPLESGCDPCVTLVCNQNNNCCTDKWDGQCIGLANQLCNNACCGDGQCVAEQCDQCLSDCGSCPPAPTCPHTVCFGSDNAEPLNTTDCYDPCISEVCAVIDGDTDNCCNPEPPVWSAECTAKAKQICGEYACIKDVCAAMPSCCTGNWTSACVNQAVMTASCSTSCDCAHSPCQNGPNDTPLELGCNPCVDAICEADPYCCNTDWDGICVGEVGTLCGVNCN